MKNVFKVLSITALIVVIGFSVIACDDGSGSTTTTTYTVTVNGGNGSGSYAPGANVTITATVPSGQQFTNWTVNSGGATLANANSTSTSFTMPANNVTVTANFTTAVNTSLDGVWRNGSDTNYRTVTINGSTGVYTHIFSSALWQDAVNKGYLSIGDQAFRNLTKTGDLTWTGEIRGVTSVSSSPNVATGTGWENCTITINANGLTFQSVSNGGTFTWTKVTTPSLDGVWRDGSDTNYRTVTINGSTGIYTHIFSSALWQDAVNKGYLSIGDQAFRNLTKTGDLTWTGEIRGVTSVSSSPNVATGTGWENCTITINANGLTFQSVSNGGTFTWTRQ